MPKKNSRIDVCSEAIRNGDAEVLRRTLPSIRNSINIMRPIDGLMVKTQTGTLLMAAAERGEYQCVQALIEARADVNAISNFSILLAFDANISALRITFSGKRGMMKQYEACTALLIAADADVQGAVRHFNAFSRPNTFLGNPDSLQCCMVISVGCGNAYTRSVVNQQRWLCNSEWRGYSKHSAPYDYRRRSSLSEIGYDADTVRGTYAEDLMDSMVAAYTMQHFPMLSTVIRRANPSLADHTVMHYEQLVSDIYTSNHYDQWLSVVDSIWDDPLVAPIESILDDEKVYATRFQSLISGIRWVRAHDRCAAKQAREQSRFAALPGPIMMRIQEWIRVSSLPTGTQTWGLLYVIQEQLNHIRHKQSRHHK